MPKSHGLAQIVFKTVFLFPNTVSLFGPFVRSNFRPWAFNQTMQKKPLLLERIVVLNEEWFPPKPV